MTRRLTFAAGLVAILLAARAGHACGLTPPIGPNGLPAACHGDDDAVRFRAAVTGGGTATTIEFGDNEADFEQAALVGTLDAFPTQRLAFGVALGMSGLGHVNYGGLGYDLMPGMLAGVGTSYRFLGQRGLPFVHTSLTLSLARAIARAPDGSESTFVSPDWRAGVAEEERWVTWRPRSSSRGISEPALTGRLPEARAVTSFVITSAWAAPSAYPSGGTAWSRSRFWARSA